MNWEIYDTLWYHVWGKVRSVCQLFWRWSINISKLIGHFIHEFGWKLNHIEKHCWNGRVGCNGTHWTVRVAMEINQFAEHPACWCCMCVSPEPSSSGWIVLCTSSDPQEQHGRYQVELAVWGSNFGPNWPGDIPRFLNDVFDDFMPQRTHCLVVWNHGIWWLSIYWEFHNPNWRIFFRGVGIPPTSSTNVFLGVWGTPRPRNSSPCPKPASTVVWQAIHPEECRWCARRQEQVLSDSVSLLTL